MDGDLILTQHSAAIGQMKEDARLEFMALWEMLPGILAAPSITTACQAAADALGLSWQRVYSRVTKYQKSGNWLHLVNLNRAGNQFKQCVNQPLPAEFLEHWQKLCKENGRKCAPARRQLLADWRKGARIPGYDINPTANPRTGFPVGWHKSNLARHAPTKFELTASRQGRAAAAAHRPLVFTTRVGLHVGEFYVFDDFWHDFMVISYGQRQPQRLLQLHTLDLFSACNFMRGYKPIIENEMTGAQEHIKYADMQFLVLAVLSKIGYRPEGTTLVVEHGTAAIMDLLEKLLYDFTGGRVTVDRSGIEGAAAISGMYGGRPKGNFRFKAALESSGNLIHNETANMRLIPGQTGSNSRLNLPEEMHGREKHAKMLLAAMAAMPRDVVMQLRLPFLETTQAIWICNEIHDRINKRTEHDLEGWISAGLTTQEWRPDPSLDWLPMARLMQLPPDKRSMIESLISCVPDCAHIRKLTPHEVFYRDAGRLVKLPGEAVAMMLPESCRFEVAVRSHMIEFNRAAYGPDDCRYFAHKLQDGEIYQAAVNPFDPSRLFVLDAQGRYAGECSRDIPTCRGETEALQKQCGRVAKIEAELLKPVAKSGRDILRKRAEDAQHNIDVIKRYKGEAPEQIKETKQFATIADEALNEI